MKAVIPMAKNRLTVCDECGKEFKLRKHDIKKRWLGEGICEQSFKCPKCKTKYIILVTDVATRNLMREYQKDTKAFQVMQQEHRPAEVLDSALLDLKKTQALIVAQSEQLKAKWCK